jgi:hypothetical protein
MTENNMKKLRTLLDAYAERRVKAAAAAPATDQRERKLCGEVLRTVVRPVLDAVMAELKSAGHEASTREHTDRDDAYPSVALSFRPRARGEGAAAASAGPTDAALASALIFRYDPRHGVVAQRDVKAAPSKRTTTNTGDRLGTIGVDAVSAAWVETKTLSFIEAVLKAN